MSKKDRKKQPEKKMPNIASIQNDILRMEPKKSETEIRTVLIENGNSDSRDKYRLRKRDEDRVISAVTIPGRLKIDNKGYALVKFDDGTIEKYEITDIILAIASLADSHINRFYLTTGAYLSAHKGFDIVTPDVNTGDEERRIDIDKMVTSLYDGHNTDKDESEDRRETGICSLYEDLIANDFIAAFYMWEQVKRICNLVEPTREIIPHITEAEKLAIEFTKQIDKSLERDKTSYSYVYQLISKKSSGAELVRQKYNPRPYTDDEVVRILTDLYSNDEIKEFIKLYGAYIIDRKGVMKQLINKRMFTEEELYSTIDKASAFICYADNGNKELLKCLGVSDLVSLYHMGKFDISQISRYVTLKELLMSNISKDSKMEILMSGKGNRVFGKTETAVIWELFEKDYFNVDEIKELESVRYLHVNTIIKNYYTEKKRKIAAELEIVSAISDEKIVEFFTPDIVARELRSGISDEQKDFYNKELRLLYEAAGRDIEQELVDFIMNGKDEDSVQEYLECMKLYNEGFLSVDTLRRIGIPESIVENDYVNDMKDSKLVEFFNGELLSQDALVELLDEDFDSRVFDLISAGMSAKAIKGFYSTLQLIELTKQTVDEDGTTIPAKLNYNQLAEIKDDIITGLDQNNRNNQTTLLDLYLSCELSYSELYDLVAAGVISKVEADEINDRFSLEKGVAALEETGISGQPLANLIKPMPNPVPGPRPNPSPAPKRIAMGFDSKYIVEFYQKMGAKSIIQIDGEQCPVFDGYVIIPVIDKKIGFLEGDDGRTYILPLKIILEQINNPRGQMDLIGNATSRNGFNRDKRFVRSTNHTKNWVENTVKKAAEISPVMTPADVREFKKDNSRLIDDVRKSYDYRKIHKII